MIFGMITGMLTGHSPQPDRMPSTLRPHAGRRTQAVRGETRGQWRNARKATMAEGGLWVGTLPVR